VTRIGHGLGACAIAPVALAGGSSSEARGTRCAPGELRLISFGGQGAAGTEFAYLRLELRRPDRCTLTGYPGVTLLSGRRHLDIHVRGDLGYPTRTVSLDAQHPAYFNLV
jgi:hypothetical protein